MNFVDLHISELQKYIDAAFQGDEDILKYYDKKEKVNSVSDVCKNVFKKISSAYYDAEIVGVKSGGENIGYFVFSDELLISFGLNGGYRKKEILSELWEEIKDRIGERFRCVLYSHNSRALNWLQKCGMDVFCEEVTVLTFDNNKNLISCQ